MNCKFPRYVLNKKYNPLLVNNPAQYLLVPCGKCYDCLRARRREWLFRFKSEMIHSTATYFLTLTFDDNICEPRLDKRDLQLFFKRMRKYGYVFKYYAIGEYGSKGLRAHYHALIFLKSAIDYIEFYDYVKSLWKYGFISVGIANYRRLNYIGHYHIRPKHFEKGDTFALQSQGIGIQFITPDLLNSLKYTHNNVVDDYEGMRINLPRYYRKKYGIDGKSEYYEKQSLSAKQHALRLGIDEFDYIRDCQYIDGLLLSKYNEQSM